MTLSQANALLAYVDTHEADSVVEEVIALIETHYLYPDVAAAVSQALAAGLAEGRYLPDQKGLAEAVTADLQSVSGDKHLRLIYHGDPIPEREPGSDAAEYAEFRQWAERTCHGITSVERLDANVGYLNVQPVLFPTTISGDAITAAMSLLASTEALIMDLRQCIGGDPATTAWLCSYLFSEEPVELTGLHQPKLNRTTQAWTLPYVPGRRFGPHKPVPPNASPGAFSGAECTRRCVAGDAHTTTRQPPRRRQRLRQTHPGVPGSQSRPPERCPPCGHRRRSDRVTTEMRWGGQG